MKIDGAALDRYITGNYGEDQLRDDPNTSGAFDYEPDTSDISDTEPGYPEGYPPNYAAFQVGGDVNWQAGWLEYLPAGMPHAFWLLTVTPGDVDAAPVWFPTEEDARVCCWQDARAYAAKED